MPVAGPFYLAYVTDDSVAFDSVVHARMDEYVFSWRRILSETDKPVLEVEIRNPHIGILNSTRMQWAWLSWLNPANGHVEPLMLGRIVANPNNVLSEIIIVQFTSWPSDFFKQRQNVAESLKVAPFWDEVFVAVEKSDDPDTVLEAQSKLWCVDPITLVVTAEDILDASDGNVDITADQHFYDALDMHDGDAPLTAVLIDATVSWTQTGRGFIDMGQNVIRSFSGDGIIGEWPKPLAELGNGWSVKAAFAADTGGTAAMTSGSVSYSWNNPSQQHEDGDTLSLNISITAPFAGGATAPTGVLTMFQQNGFLDPFAVDGDGDPSPVNIPASFNETNVAVMPWVVSTSLMLRYDLSRQRTERIRIMLKADLQAIVNDPLVTQNSETISLTGRDVGVPIVNLLDWTTIENTDVGIGQVIFPDDPQLPGGRSAQVAVVAGHTGIVEPEFSDIPGVITIDNTVEWASLGTQQATEGAQDWTGFTNFSPGAIILPRYPLWANLADLLRPGQLQFPPVGTPISLGEIVFSNGEYLVCTVDGIIGPLVGQSSATLVSLGATLPDGKTYYITPNGGQSGALYVTPQFGAHTTLHDSINDNGITWVSIGSGDIPAGGTPGNVWARWYFPSDRGNKSVQYLMAIGRAHIRKRARAVEIEFECPFELGISITCRKTVTLHDSRIPGGVALGKVVRAELSVNGDTGEVKCHVTIGCAVGRGNAVTTVPGTGVYATDGYMQSGYQQVANSIVVLPDLTDVGYTPLVAAPDDDGLVLPLDKLQVVISEGVKGSIGDQLGGINSAFGSMKLAAQITNSPGFFGFGNTIEGSQAAQRAATLLQSNSVARQLQLNPIYYELVLKPVVNGPFWDSYVVATQRMTLPKGIDLEAATIIDDGGSTGGGGSSSGGGGGGIITGPSTYSVSVSEPLSATDTPDASSTGGGGGSTPDAPVITRMRSAGAQNTLFNISNGGTTKSNHLDVYGTSANAGATLSVYVGGSLDGTTTTDGGGNWLYTIDNLTDAAHVITAKVTVGSDTSAASANYGVTVSPGLTSLPVSVGQNMVNGSNFSWGGESFVTNSTNQTSGHTNSTCCVVTDTHRLTFTLLPTDLYTDFGSPSNRSEYAMNGRYADGVTLNMSYGMKFSSGSPTNSNFGPGKWCVIGQLHDSGGSSPPFEWNFGGDANNSGTSGDQLCGDYYNGSTYAQLYRMVGNLPRGVEHFVDITIKPHATAGRLLAYVNRVKVIDYSGPLHEISPYYWKDGMYRGPTPGETSTQVYERRNFLCVRS